VEGNGLVNDCAGCREEPVHMQDWSFVTVRNICMKLVENLVTHSNWREMNSRYNFEIMREVGPLIALWFQTEDIEILIECLCGLCVRQKREHHLCNIF
jgi:hypothetical protein